MESASLIAAELVDATKRFGNVTALDTVSLTVTRGETLALLGPNGAGKTTAISLLLGLRPPTSGTARIFGRDPRDPAARAQMGAMLQESGMPATLTAREALDFVRALYPDPLPTNAVLEIADLAHRSTSRIATLSGGEKQRMYFALALIGRPALLFLDEPTVALDVETRRRFWNEIRALVTRGTTIVLTTHYLEEADALADRIVVVDHGRVIASGRPDEIKGRVGGRYVRFRSSAVTEIELLALAGVQRVTTENGAWRLLTLDAEGNLARLFAMGVALDRLEVFDAGLEEAFVALTSGRQGTT